MSLKLFNKVFHGAILKRVEDFVHERAPTFRVVSLGDLSFAIGEDSGPPKEHTVRLRQDKLDSLTFVKEGDLVFGLTAYKAMIIGDALDGALLSSNFVQLTLDLEKQDPHFMMWYINESTDFKRMLETLKQGTVLKSLSIEGLRKLRATIPPLETQRQIGNLYRLELKNIKMQQRRHQLYKDYLKSLYKEKGHA